MSRSAPAQAVLGRLTSWGLDDRSAPIDASDASTAAEVVDGAVEERLIGVLAVAVASAGVDLAPSEVDRLAERWEQAMAWCLRLEVRLLELHAELGSRGVDLLVLKGPAAAHLDEPDPSLRPFADLDLLVRSEQLSATVVALGEDGATRPWAPRRAGFDERFAKSVTVRLVDGVEVDLHRTLADGALGMRVPVDDLWRSTSTFELGGARLRCLDRPARALHAAYHAVLGSPTPRLMSVREVLAHLTDPTLPPDDVTTLAARWRGEPVLAAALDLVRDATGVEATAYGAWRAAQGDRDQAIVARQRAEGSGLGRAKLDVLRELPWRDRPSYAWALAVPSAEHLRSRGLRRRDLLRRHR